MPALIKHARLCIVFFGATYARLIPSYIAVFRVVVAARQADR